ncbi:macro domain-containing protein [Streptococcus timonensis]|uniref:macro domain-containing protein n=1 Tax=Streptococcus timonensis TaxID=1852387 RepID=UPI0039C173AB
MCSCRSTRQVRTKAFNLYFRYVLHTVGSIIYEEVTNLERQKLGLTYEECLTLAYEQGLRSLAFCCFLTGEFGFSNEEVAKRRLYSFRNNSLI